MTNPAPSVLTERSWPDEWMEVRPEGLYCRPGGFFVDPSKPVPLAVVSHGHADHARPGHGAVVATAETLEIVRARYGEEAYGQGRPLALGETALIGEARVRLEPAGHVLGSAQAVMEFGGCRVVYTGDYKATPDPTCAAWEPVACDVLITEATFGLPVFRHPPVGGELAKLLASLEAFPERCHAVGAYALGKAQRLIAELRVMGYDRPVYLHGALEKLCALYQAHGVPLGELRPATAGAKGKARDGLRGSLVIAPPSALADRWARRLPDPVIGAASGWMRVRGRARQKNVELPLVISDHCDWNELLAAVDACAPAEVWVTHGREEALIRALSLRGVEAKALSLLGREEED